jgi:hypothetical protein
MNRKDRRANKIPSQKAPKPPPPGNKYAVTYAGSKPGELSHKEASIVLAMTSQVPFTAGLVSDDPEFTFEDFHVHVLLKNDRKVCLRWQEADIPGVFEGTCEKL